MTKNAAVKELDHALVRHHLTRLRDRRTPPDEFRRTVRRLTYMLVYESSGDLPEETVRIETPLAAMDGRRFAGRIGLFPILRAGLGMLDAALECLPEAEVWHLGLFRDEQTLKPVEYYNKMPDTEPVQAAIVLDPMLATGGSAAAALDILHGKGIRDVRLLSIIAAPEGIRRVRESHPATRIHVCAVDHYLNEKAYIVPGLGDAGDRLFNAAAL